LAHLSGLEIGLILAGVLLLFGIPKIAQLGGALGKSMREFRKARAGDDSEDEKDKDGVSSAESGAKETG
jgi:sec-independent protein translocase protein TatA